MYAIPIGRLTASRSTLSYDKVKRVFSHITSVLF